MNRYLRLATATLALAAASLTARAAEPGFVDLGKFQAASGCDFVEVNLHTPLLKFASLFVGKEDPEAAELIRGLKHVRVNVVGYDETTRAGTTEHVQKIRHELEAQGWEQMVTVRQADQTDDVAIYVKMANDDSIDGLVVTVIDAGKKQAVIVNVVGNIKPEQLAAVGKGLHLDPLCHMKVSASVKGA